MSFIAARSTTKAWKYLQQETSICAEHIHIACFLTFIPFISDPHGAHTQQSLSQSTTDDLKLRGGLYTFHMYMAPFPKRGLSNTKWQLCSQQTSSGNDSKNIGLYPPMLSFSKGLSHKERGRNRCGFDGSKPHESPFPCCCSLREEEKRHRGLHA